MAAESIAGISDDLVAAAAALCGGRIIAAEPCGGGGNNRVYRIQAEAGPYALKAYESAELDERDRLGHEFNGLQFLNTQGIGGMVPAALAIDPSRRCALYEWIEGTSIEKHEPEDLNAVFNLLRALHDIRNTSGAQAQPNAIESIFTLCDLMHQIETRLERLLVIAPSEPELSRFLREELQPELKRRLGSIQTWDKDAVLAANKRTLSPSDFGFHNALRRPDASLCFIDFEYFGWDDPVKLSADFLWHPAMSLSDSERHVFLDQVHDLYGTDPDFDRRLTAYFPLIGIRWILIILNEFLPKLWARRRFSGKGGDWEAAKRAQLHKARVTLATLHS